MSRVYIVRTSDHKGVAVKANSVAHVSQWCSTRDIDALSINEEIFVNDVVDLTKGGDE
jgi:hypothetical protein